MMKAYIQCNFKGMPFNETVYNAYLGFEEMGVETILFKNHVEMESANIEDIIVGGIGPTKKWLNYHGCHVPELDYPDELKGYLKRNVWTSKIDTINANPSLWPVFVKPFIDKKFTGRVIKNPADLIGCGSCYENYDVFCSDVIILKAEWRVFVRYGTIMDVRRYKGDWGVHFDPDVIKRCVDDYKTQPSGYGIDFGVTDKGETVLIEVNDGVSLGAYGLHHIYYAKLLSARWAELTNTVDELNF